MIRLLAPFLLVGCDCPHFFSGIEINDPGGVADTEMLRNIRAGIADFARWSDVDGVCVREVRVRKDLENGDGHSLYGQYQRPLKRILIDPDAEDARKTTRHELCHAWDADHGWWSYEQDDLFVLNDHRLPPGGGLAERWTSAGQTFAYTCQNPPAVLDTLAMLDRSCAPLPGPRVAAAVREAVYPSVPVEVFAEGADFRLGEPASPMLELDALRRADILVQHQGGHHLVSFSWFADCVGAHCDDTLHFTDLDDGQTRSRPIILPEGFPDAYQPAILPSSHQPMLVFHSYAGSPVPLVAYPLDPENGTVRPFSVPEPLQTSWSEVAGWVSEDGIAYIAGIFEKDGPHRLFRWDLLTGETAPLEPPPGVELDLIYVSAVAAAGDRMVLAGAAPGGSSLVFFGESDADWSVVPAPAMVDIRGLLPLGREEILVSYDLRLPADLGLPRDIELEGSSWEKTRNGLALYTGGLWQVESVDCDFYVDEIIEKDGAPHMVDWGKKAGDIFLRPIHLP